ncbi:hypothetical protein [Streptomyces spectabilis]|uniref:Uncharacterized protein n=1 Tax=Streptomyces spectabilis TaxID=68270 RepID=A0A5P2X8A8_STRST|nr:hypothetical protein [Streptomyces spectabilis]MBB5103643.1 hypothetical protein [Streptomyces spectabilis]MCI3904112.1 hypothetical protein [Streptomyces spectabilis]QEV61243.1 hypothetical protein CP982_23145 [Streptomyces spectabilis]GGV19581.1 hypothetical protein GCM10010245_33230 [Streptomyces spectabilis]
MDTGITVAAVLAMIALGAFLIHLLNDQHADRIALRQYARRLPGRSGSHSPAQPQPDSTAPPAVRARRDHRDGGRGRLRPRRRTNRAAKGRRT